MLNNKAVKLFENWDETLIWSCLQGHMGTMIVDDENNLQSAIIHTGDFCFCAGLPNKNLFEPIHGFKLLVPKDEAWQRLIEAAFEGKAKKTLRYAIKKEPNVFDVEKLKSYVNSLDKNYELKLFSEEMFNLAISESWSVDLCSQFQDYEDYKNRAIGVGILNDGKLIAGASTYGVFNHGIEIEIDTKPEYRGKGLATVCGSKLIIECLSRGIYPSWDAHDLRSVHLAEKLGYHLSHPYVTYEIVI